MRVKHVDTIRMQVKQQCNVNDDQQKHVIIQTQTGFQTPCKDAFGSQKPYSKGQTDSQTKRL